MTSQSDQQFDSNQQRAAVETAGNQQEASQRLAEQQAELQQVAQQIQDHLQMPRPLKPGDYLPVTGVGDQNQQLAGLIFKGFKKNENGQFVVDTKRIINNRSGELTLSDGERVTLEQFADNIASNIDQGKMNKDAIVDIEGFYFGESKIADLPPEQQGLARLLVEEKMLDDLQLRLGGRLAKGDALYVGKLGPYDVSAVYQGIGEDGRANWDEHTGEKSRRVRFYPGIAVKRYTKYPTAKKMSAQEFSRLAGARHTIETKTPDTVKPMGQQVNKKLSEGDMDDLWGDESVGDQENELTKKLKEETTPSEELIVEAMRNIAESEGVDFDENDTHLRKVAANVARTWLENDFYKRHPEAKIKMENIEESFEDKMLNLAVGQKIIIGGKIRLSYVGEDNDGRLVFKILAHPDKRMNEKKWKNNLDYFVSIKDGIKFE